MEVKGTTLALALKDGESDSNSLEIFSFAGVLTRRRALFERKGKRGRGEHGHPHFENEKKTDDGRTTGYQRTFGLL